MIYRIADETSYESVVKQMQADRGGQTIMVDQRGETTRRAGFTPKDGGKIGFYSNVVTNMGLN